MSNSPRIYLIANNGGMSDEYIESINSTHIIGENDMIVRFNNAVARTLKIFDGKTTDIALRSSNTGFHGTNRQRQLIGRFKRDENTRLRFILWRGMLNSAQKTMNVIAQKNELKYSEDDNIILDTNVINHTPSSGFMTILRMIEKYPEAEIYLIGFNFKNSTKSNYHNWKGEKEYVDNLVRENKVHYL